MAVIGCDYSASEAFFAIVNNEEVQLHEKIKLLGDLEKQKAEYFGKLKNFFHKSWDANDGTLYMEEPWVAQGHFVNAAIKLARNAAWIEMAASVSGYKVVKVHVSTWRKGVYGNGKPQDPKGTATAWCLYNLGFETKNHNFAEAACISYFGGKGS